MRKILIDRQCCGFGADTSDIGRMSLGTPSWSTAATPYSEANFRLVELALMDWTGEFDEHYEENTKFAYINADALNAATCSSFIHHHIIWHNYRHCE